MSTQTFLTAKQFAQLPPEETEDCELVDGELIPLSSGTFGHGQIRDRIIAAFLSYLARNPIGVVVGEVDCELSARIVRRPDISFFLTTNPTRTVPREQVPIPFPPDIAVEVLSPSESAMKVNRKVNDCLTAGCREVWVVDRENGEVFIHTEDEVRRLRRSAGIESAVLPGFELSVHEILAQ